MSRTVVEFWALRRALRGVLEDFTRVARLADDSGVAGGNTRVVLEAFDHVKRLLYLVGAPGLRHGLNLIELSEGALVRVLDVVFAQSVPSDTRNSHSFLHHAPLPALAQDVEAPRTAVAHGR